MLNTYFKAIKHLKHPFMGPRFLSLTLMVVTVFTIFGLSSTLLAKSNKPSKTNTQIEVIIEGVPKDIQKNILQQLSLELHKADKDLSIDKIEFMHRRAEKEIEMAVVPFGYYDIKSTGYLEYVNHHWKAKYNITLGPPVKITNIHLKVLGPLEAQIPSVLLKTLFKLKVGDVLHHDLYENGKRDLLIYAINQGYSDAKFIKNQILVNPQEHKADVELILDSGPLYYIGSIDFPNDPFEPTFLQKYVPYKLNTPLAPKAIYELQNNLNQSGYFNYVNVEPNFEGKTTNHYVPLNITLTPVKPSEYLFGLGYGTDTGIRTRLGYERRYINRHGHQLMMSSFISRITQQVETRYKIPANRPNTDFYQIKGMLKHEKFDSAISQKDYYIKEIGLIETHEYKRWQRITSFNWHNESFKDSRDAQITRQSFLLPSVLVTYGKMDDLIHPTRGYRFSLMLTGSLNTLLSSSTFLQSHFKAKYLRPISENVSLLLRGELGAIIPNDLEDIPLSMRFFAGGDQSIRGFGYKSLGPKSFNSLKQKVVLGGTHLLIGSTEVIYRVKDPFALSLFLDAGNAFNKINTPLEYAAGIGFRWNTKIGDIKLEFAQPLSRPGSSYHMHFTFGPDL